MLLNLKTQPQPENERGTVGMKEEPTKMTGYPKKCHMVRQMN